MIRSVSQEPSRSALKRRRQEVEEILAGFGLARGPRRLGTRACETSRVRSLRTALEALGPVFSAFGIYLSTRADLLPAEDRIELGKIRDWSDPLPPSAARSMVSSELGRAPHEVFLTFGEAALQSRLLFQSHRGEFADGQRAIVQFIRPEVEESLRYDVALLPLLKVGFANDTLSGEAFDVMAEDYCRTLGRQIDCLQQASAFNVLARDAEEFGMLSVPVVHQSLCGSRLLTIEYLHGSTLDQILSSCELEKSEAGGSTRVSVDREDLARRLCTVWLRQVFLGRLFPLEPSAANTLILSNGQVVFMGGGFDSLQPEPKANLCDYLVAVANDDPDHAYDCLFKELMCGGRGREQENLLKRFRQIVPLREGAWTTAGDSDNLAEYVFAHWRLASECGPLPQHLSSFYRSLFVIAGLAQRLAPNRDALFEGLQDMRFVGGVEKLRDMVDPRHLGEQVEKYGTILTELPRRLDQVLTLVADGRARLNLQIPESAQHRRQKNSSATVVSLLVVLGAVALISHRLQASLVGGWIDELSALVFIALGGLLLRAASRA